MEQADSNPWHDLIGRVFVSSEEDFVLSMHELICDRR